ncbi:hypothetical protein GCM10010449_33330 [Streptomyces rectiviolaceus]|uniref:HTH hxlR-type domain-containing protein n=2 Tax=Streptomyces rectiviolaceus TaxID=332591 RepID=A0ABP6MF53_9ACTN
MRTRKLKSKIGRPVHAGLPPGDERFLQRIHDFFHLLNGEWHWDILVALHDGPLRYTELLNTVRARTPVSNWPGNAHHFLQEDMLSRTLQRLTQGELIERERSMGFPYATTYRLAPAARELLTVMAPAAEWTEAHSALVVRVQGMRQRVPEE